MTLKSMPRQFLYACYIYCIYWSENAGKHIRQIRIILAMPYLDWCIGILKIGCLFYINLLSFPSKLLLMKKHVLRQQKNYFFTFTVFTTLLAV